MEAICPKHSNTFSVASCKLCIIEELQQQLSLVKTNSRLQAESILRLQAAVTSTEMEAHHWKYNHATQVAASRYLKERQDISPERVRCHDEFLALKQQRDEYKKDADRLSFLENRWLPLSLSSGETRHALCFGIGPNESDSNILRESIDNAMRKRTP